jgi:hypothetical protein
MRFPRRVHSRSGSGLNATRKIRLRYPRLATSPNPTSPPPLNAIREPTPTRIRRRRVAKPEARHTRAAAGPSSRPPARSARGLRGPGFRSRGGTFEFRGVRVRGTIGRSTGRGPQRLGGGVSRGEVVPKRAVRRVIVLLLIPQLHRIPRELVFHHRRRGPTLAKAPEQKLKAKFESGPPFFHSSVETAALSTRVSRVQATCTTPPFAPPAAAQSPPPPRHPPPGRFGAATLRVPKGGGARVTLHRRAARSGALTAGSPSTLAPCELAAREMSPPRAGFGRLWGRARSPAPT